MKYIIEDIEEHCPECKCSPEETVKFLVKRGDISLTANQYREIWGFYKSMSEEMDGSINKRKKQARELTMEHYHMSLSKFRHIRMWANQKGL